MGKCCSTVPPEHAYTPIDIEKKTPALPKQPKPKLKAKPQDIQNITPHKDEIEIHSESISYKNESSNDYDSEEKKLINNGNAIKNLETRPVVATKKDITLNINNIQKSIINIHNDKYISPVKPIKEQHAQSPVVIEPRKQIKVTPQSPVVVLSPVAIQPIKEIKQQIPENKAVVSSPINVPNENKLIITEPVAIKPIKQEIAVVSTVNTPVNANKLIVPSPVVSSPINVPINENKLITTTPIVIQPIKQEIAVVLSPLTTPVKGNKLTVPLPIVIEEFKEIKEDIVLLSPVNENKATNRIQVRPSPSRSPSRSVHKSIQIINEYKGNNSIKNLRKMYIKEYTQTHSNSSLNKIKKNKSIHSVKKSQKKINQYNGNINLKKLKKKYKKTHKVSSKNQIIDVDIDDYKLDCDIDRVSAVKLKKTKSRHSVRRSSKIVNEYKGNNDIAILKEKYLAQYAEEKKNNRKSIIIPPKPKNINDYINKYINMMHDDMIKYINTNMHYIGMMQFDNNNEICIDIKFKSNKNGLIRGSRTIINNGNHNYKNKIIKINGNGKIYKDLLWNKEQCKWECCIKFEWIDINIFNNIKTKLIFNTITNDNDIDHLYFEGKCCQYVNNDIFSGVFNMVCISMRKRDCLKRDGLLNYHKIDIWNMNDDQLKNVPKYIKCMNITSVKMHKIYLENA